MRKVAPVAGAVAVALGLGAVAPAAAPRRVQVLRARCRPGARHHRGRRQRSRGPRHRAAGATAGPCSARVTAAWSS